LRARLKWSINAKKKTDHDDENDNSQGLCFGSLNVQLKRHQSAKEAGSYKRDTIGFSRVVHQLLPRAKQQRFLETTDFSRVEIQFPPNFAPSKKAETEPPHD
jgi:hypothetical protein